MTEKREAYLQKLKAMLDEWNAEIDILEAKAAQADADAKIYYQGKLEDLRTKKNDVMEKIEGIRQAEESAWEDLKQGLENSWDILKESFKEAKSEFKRGYREGMKEDD